MHTVPTPNAKVQLSRRRYDGDVAGVPHRPEDERLGGRGRHAPPRHADADRGRGRQQRAPAAPRGRDLLRGAEYYERFL